MTERGPRHTKGRGFRLGVAGALLVTILAVMSRMLGLPLMAGAGIGLVVGAITLLVVGDDYWKGVGAGVLAAVAVEALLIGACFAYVDASLA